jgi:hypothetical protein
MKLQDIEHVGHVEPLGEIETNHKVRRFMFVAWRSTKRLRLRVSARFVVADQKVDMCCVLVAGLKL